MVKKIFSSQSSQEIKVYFGKSTDTTKKVEEDSKTTKSSFEVVDENQESDEITQSGEATQSSQDSWWSSWSGLSQTFTSKGEKRDMSEDEEEEPWCVSFCSESTKRDKLSQPSSSSSQQKETEPEISSDSLSQVKKESNNDD